MYRCGLEIFNVTYIYGIFKHYNNKHEGKFDCNEEQRILNKYFDIN